MDKLFPGYIFLICAGISSWPSNICLKQPSFSGTILFRKATISFLTPGSAFLLINKTAEVCLMKICNNPLAGKPINSFVNNLKGGGYYVLELEAEWFYV
jgi:hypothetical protein